MSLRKYQSVESVRLASPTEHSEIEERLHRVGKTSAQDLSPEARRAVSKDDTVDDEE